jgi:hypothetical protein
MTVIGTKRFWKPATGASANQSENQILKNSGYFNIQLFACNYMSRGNFWQDTFGGNNKVALSTSLKFDSGTSSVEAVSVQDVRVVGVNDNFSFSLQRNIAVKIPANVEAISMDIKITEIKTDELQTKFEMLNKPEFQAEFQLAPLVVGRFIAITSLVKKLFTDTDPKAELEASFAGIISNDREASPVENGKLTQGMLILIATNEGPAFTGANDSDFSMKGHQLYFKGNAVENTYVLFNITYEALKGITESSNWSKKYNEAISYLDKIEIAADQAEIEKIFKEAKDIWIGGNALIDADETYVNKEKSSIKALMIANIKQKYAQLTKPDVPVPQVSSEQVLKSISGSTSFDIFKTALPLTGSLLNPINDVPNNVFNTYEWMPSSPIDNDQLFENLKEDSKVYLADLKLNNLPMGKQNKTNDFQ